MNNTAQLSIEAILVIAAMLSATAILLPGAIAAKNSLESALEKKKAGHFLEQVEQKACMLKAFSENSTARVRAEAAGLWQIELGEKGKIIVEGVAEVERKMRCGTEKYYSEKKGGFEIVLRKSLGKIVAGN